MFGFSRAYWYIEKAGMNLKRVVCISLYRPPSHLHSASPPQLLPWSLVSMHYVCVSEYLFHFVNIFSKDNLKNQGFNLRLDSNYPLLILPISLSLISKTNNSVYKRQHPA